jgi:hypothetical protein
MNDYLIPANSKKGQLLFGVFRPIDLGVLISGAFVTLLLLFIIKGDAIPTIAVKLLPLTICVLLVVPVPYYHNVLVFIQEAVIFIMEPKQFSWRGWCAKYEYGSQQK